MVYEWLLSHKDRWMYAPGLGIICRSHSGNGGDKKYSITHIPSGREVFALSDYDRAKALVRVLDKMGNWDTSWQEVRRFTWDDLPTRIHTILVEDFISAAI